MTYPDPATTDTYGGLLANKRAVTDPTTQQDAGGFNVMKADCAAMTNTAAQAWCRFVGHATTPTLAVTNGSGSIWGNAPGVRPTPSHAGAGHFQLTYPTANDDALGVSHTTNFHWAEAHVEGSTAYKAQASVTGNVVDVYTFLANGTADNLAGVTILVKVG